jgi:hypothetical protein
MRHFKLALTKKIISLKNPLKALWFRIFLFLSKRTLYVPERVMVKEYVGDDGIIHKEKPLDFGEKYYSVRKVPEYEYEFYKQYRFPRYAVKAYDFLLKHKNNDPRIKY